VVVWISCDS